MESNLAFYFFMAGGLFSIAGAVFNWGFFMNHRKAQMFIKVFGHTGTRIFYALLGLVIFGIGAAGLLGFLGNM